jgi:GTPase Era involved in 16S rRNA processing
MQWETCYVTTVEEVDIFLVIVGIKEEEREIQKAILEKEDTNNTPIIGTTIGVPKEAKETPKEAKEAKEEKVSKEHVLNAASLVTEQLSANLQLAKSVKRKLTNARSVSQASGTSTQWTW